MAQIIIDGAGSSLGRIASYSAKQALQGNEIIILNSEKVIISGNKKNIIEKYRELRLKGGHSQKGPQYIKIAYKMMRRATRNMLPDHRRGIGKEAYSRIKCYNDVPEEFKDKKMEKFRGIGSDKYITLKELSQKI